MNNQTFTTNRDELIKLTKDQLFKICVDNNITVKKSSNKTTIIDDIIIIKEERDCLQKKLVDDNPSNQFHRGHVEYKLPVLILTKIFELTWMISTYDRRTLLITYRQALQLTLINKQLFGIVSEMFNKVQLRVIEKSKQIEDLYNRLTNVWCPIKHIVKLDIGIPIFEAFIKQPSVHLTHILSTVEKLHIHHETNCGRLKVTSIKTFGTIATNLRSLYLHSVTMIPAHLNAICSIKSLRKIDISSTFNRPRDILTILCNGLPLLESIKSSYLKVTDIPIASRSRIRKLSDVSLSETDETFEFPNLQKISFAYNTVDPDRSFFKYFSLSNITHLSVYLKSNIYQWIPIIIELKCLVTLEDLEYHCRSDGKVMNIPKYSIPATLSRIIIATDELLKPDNLLIDIGFQYSKSIHLNEYDCKMIYNKIIIN
ncbi:hypothetical protein PPL_03421 [Heterostelium album PN500]|uniref:Zer-1-like leucine-rich repeats region domain-containing protein n=1 Tax=Heterostelium pallidum (strain ATCC 26659 / Pp 5 / PN500) TaxID=670386 RepID=D3B4U5_HETP5|nr:hypothetical protein PPL_03421 [Heterostelium album PN500]EFA84343.1 hypothetical protein PPL_03421 [Heterostelium album PN500]|eukprot:XP_020436458.1 hypothetical protein PPL_03421 [Heterostelium album PN500]